MDQFEEVLSKYLKPGQTQAKLILRDEEHQEMAFVPYTLPSEKESVVL